LLQLNLRVSHLPELMARDDHHLLGVRENAQLGVITGTGAQNN
jgi:hypothetical protein